MFFNGENELSRSRLGFEHFKMGGEFRQIYQYHFENIDKILLTVDESQPNVFNHFDQVGAVADDDLFYYAWISLMPVVHFYPVGWQH